MERSVLKSLDGPVEELTLGNPVESTLEIKAPLEIDAEICVDMNNSYDDEFCDDKGN